MWPRRLVRDHHDQNLSLSPCTRALSAIKHNVCFGRAHDIFQGGIYNQKPLLDLHNSCLPIKPFCFAPLTYAQYSIMTTADASQVSGGEYDYIIAGGGMFMTSMAAMFGLLTCFRRYCRMCACLTTLRGPFQTRALDRGWRKV